MDFGYTNPFVCQWWAKDPDGRLYLYRESYRVHLLVEDAARDMLALSADEPRPWAIVCDHDAEDRATLERHLGMTTVAAVKDVSPGIQAVARPAQGRRRPASPGCSCSGTPSRGGANHAGRGEEADRPGRGLDGYVWNVAANRKAVRSELKLDDHGADAMGTSSPRWTASTVPG